MKKLEAIIRPVKLGDVKGCALPAKRAPTATNLSLTVAGTSRAEVVAGVNMPMLVKTATARGTMGLHELAGIICRYGRDHIFRASEGSPSTDGAVRR